MNIGRWIALGALTIAGASALAQTPLPITNGSFENDDPIFGGLLGYNVLPGSDVSTDYHRTGDRCVMLGPGDLNNFIGITTDTVNIYVTGRPYYDPSIDWYGGNHVRHVLIAGRFRYPHFRQRVFSLDRLRDGINDIRTQGFTGKL